MEPDQKQHLLRRLEILCRERGLAVTIQRKAVLAAVLDRDDHPTADQVYEDLHARLPSISRATVYRVLQTLVDLGLVNKACAPRASIRFDRMTQRHHHLVCLDCDKLIDITDEGLIGEVMKPPVDGSGFEIRDFSIHFYGICAACREKSGSKKSSG